MSEDGRDTGVDNTTDPEEPSDNVSPSPGTTAGQLRSIWNKYVTVAGELDRQMVEKWKTNLGNLLIFAGLFTAIVTAFALDAMSSIGEDTSTQLLRILVEQSAVGQDVDIPQPNPPSSIVTVNTLWFLSIMSSLAATTWAILSLEWCAFLTADGVRSKDYQEMAEKRQRKFEAIRRWKVHLIVASIPFFLHLSLFLFLAGLWLRLRDVNGQLGLVVGIPSLIIVSTYVVVTLLPLFTMAPFSTSVSEMIQPLVDDIKYLLKLRRFVRRPPLLTLISGSLRLMFGKLFSCLDSVYRVLHFPFRVAATLLILSLKYTYRFADLIFHSTWTVARKILWAIFPTLPPGGDPFRELSRFRMGPYNRNKRVHQRALFWLMNTPLTQHEVKEVLKELKELRGQGKVEEPLDRAMVRLLVSSLSSVLWDRVVTEQERPVFDHCTMLLTDEMARMFHDTKYDPVILVWSAEISDGLKGYVDFDISAPPPPQTPKDDYDDYWNRVVRLLWLSPSREQIRDIIRRLEPNPRSVMPPPLLLRIVRGLHAATLTSLMANESQSVLDFPLPDFSQWDFSDNNWSTSEYLDLDGELSGFLQNLLAKYHKSVDQQVKAPTTTPELIAALLSLGERGDVPSNFPSALRLFITTTWRSNPGVFDTDFSVAQTLVISVKNFVASSTPDTPDRSIEIATRLRTIANGPKPVTSWQQMIPLETIASLYTGPVKDDKECLSGFIHVTAAALEAVLVKGSHPGVPEWRRYVDRRVIRTVVSPSFFTDRVAFRISLKDPHHRLPYLYSLAIALSHGIEGTEHDPSEVLGLLRTPDEQRENAAIGRILDTNVLVVNVLRHILPRRAGPAVVETDQQTYADKLTQALQPLEGIIEDREMYSWRTRWKAIYLLADIGNVFPGVLATFEKLQPIIDATSEAVRTYIAERLEDEPAPHDWRMKKDGLRVCGLEEAVRELAKRDESSKGVYGWRESGNIPYLSLYPQRTRYDLTSHAPYRFLEKVQRFVDEDASMEDSIQRFFGAGDSDSSTSSRQSADEDAPAAPGPSNAQNNLPPV